MFLSPLDWSMVPKISENGTKSKMEQWLLQGDQILDESLKEELGKMHLQYNSRVLYSFPVSSNNSGITNS